MARRPSVILSDENLAKEELKGDLQALRNELRDLEKARTEEMRTHTANMAKYEREEATLRRKLERIEGKV
jgi:hypothetical protein